jgi:elongation factor G
MANDLSHIRNFGIISHIDAGKTTLSERILFYTGEIHKMGEVHDGMATMDWMEQEQERGITITATATSCHWKEYSFNLIDTPGHIDFTIEVERSLRALDGAIAIFSAVEGVQPQSESVWRQADRYHVPRLCLINKMDRIGADYHKVLSAMRERLDATPVLLQLPVGEEENFGGVIDLIQGEMIRFSDSDQGRTIEVEAIPETYQEQARQQRDALLEAVADYDDSILSDFLSGNNIDPKRIIAALRKGVNSCKLFPVLLGSALRNKGVQPLLQSLCELLPSPLDTPPAAATELISREPRLIHSDPKKPLCALAFKVLADAGRKLTYLRLYSGQLQPGDNVFNSRTQKEEKVARMFRMHAHKRERIDRASAGDIVTVTGLKEVLTGDTISSPGLPLQLAGLEYPEPVVSLAIEAKTIDGRDKLPLILEKLQWEDPTFRVREDEETGQTLLTGMGELHLEVICERLRSDFGVEVATGRPQVVYRETITRQAERHEVFEREIDGRWHFGEVEISVKPLPRSNGLEINIPEQLLTPWPAPLSELIHTQLENCCRSGPLAGYPLTDIHLSLTAATYDNQKTTDLGISAAINRAVARALATAGTILLEPVMTLELVAPTNYTGRVMGSLTQKRGQVEGITSGPGQDIITAQVPLFEMFGYMTELRSATQGQASFTMEFSHFEPAPKDVRSKLGLI